MTDRVVRVRLSADISAFRQAMQNAAGDTDGLKDKFNNLGDVAKKAFAGLTIATVIKSSVGAAVDFEGQLNTLRAVSGATADQMKRVSETAKQLGNDAKLPGQSAATAAEAMTELAKGGLSVDEAMKAATGTLQLASAAQIDGAQAAEIQANALNTFGLEADQAGRVADVLANTANAASGEITDFGMAISQAGLVAAGLGITIEDTSTALGLFANAGLKGSDAGTSLKSMLVALSSPSKEQAKALGELGVNAFDAAGNFVGLRSVTEQLAAAQGEMSQQQFANAAATAFGTDAVRAASAMAAAGVDDYDDLAAAVGKAGGAAELAGANAEGLPGALGNAQNAVENLALAFGEALAPAAEGGLGILSGAVNGLADFVGWFSQLPTPIIAAGTALAGLGLLKATGLFGALRSAAGNVLSPLRSATMQMAAMREVAALTGTRLTALGAGLRVAGTAAAGFGRSLLGAVGGPWGLAITAGITALALFAGKQKEVHTTTVDMTGAIDEQTGALAENAAEVTRKALADADVINQMSKLGVSGEQYVAAILNEGDARDMVTAQLRDQLEATLAQEGAQRKLTGSYGQSLGTIEGVARRLMESGDSAQFSSEKVDALVIAYQQLLSDTNSLDTQQRRTNEGLGDSARLTGRAADGYQYYAESTEAAAEATDKVAEASESAAAATAEQVAANLNYQRVIGENEAANQRDADAVDRARDAYEKAEDALTPMGEAAQTAADAQGELADATDRVLTKLDEMSGRVPTVEESMRNLHEQTAALAEDFGVGEEGFEGFTGKIAKGTGIIDTATESGRMLYDNVTQIAEANVTGAKAAFDAAGGYGNLKEAQAAAGKVAQGTYDDWMKQADVLGLTPELAQAVAEAYGLIPKDVKTAITADAKQAKEQQAEVDRKQRELDASEAEVLVTGDNSDAQAKADATEREWLALDGRSARVSISAEDRASQTLAHIRSLLDNIPRQVSTVVTVSKQGAVAGGGMFTDSGVSFGPGMPGFAGGGKLPGTTPADKSRDNLLAVGPGGPVAVQSGEFLMNSTQTAKNEKWLWWMNSGGVLPGFAAGGTVSAGALAGNAARQMGSRESISTGALGDLAAWIRDLAEASRDAAKESRESSADYREALRDYRKASKEDKAAARAKVDQAAKQMNADKRAASAAKSRADAESRVWRAQEKARDVLRGLTQAFDRGAARLESAKDRLGTARDRLAGTRADKASMASGIAGSVAGANGGLLGNVDTRSTPTGFLAGLGYRAKQAAAFAKNIASLKGKGLNAGMLAEIAGGGEDGMKLAAGLAGASKQQIAQANALNSRINVSANQVGGLAAGAKFDKIIMQQAAGVKAAHDAVVRLERRQASVDKAIDTLARGVDLKWNGQVMARAVRDGERQLQGR